MWLRKTGIAVTLAGLLWGAAARGQVNLFSRSISSTPVLTQWVRSGWLTFRVVSGRIAIGGTRQHHNISSSSRGLTRKERLSMRSVNGQTSLTYERTNPKEQLLIELAADQELRITRTGKEDPDLVPVRFSQAANEPTRLTLGEDEQQREYRAASLWHLLITRPEECRNHLIPILELMHPGWKLAEKAAAAEKELLRVASGRQLPDRSQWAALVEQLGDDRFAKREAADRQLRSLDQAVLGYLRGLDFNRLDAEQQFRVRRIVISLSQHTEDDTPENVAERLSGDAEIWLALLGRPQESTRRQAARQLAALLGEPIPVDPAADPASQEGQIERLRVRIEGRAPHKGA